MRKRLLFFVFGFLFIVAARAQETTSDIAGQVIADKTPLAGATVTAVHTPSGTSYKTTTRSDGRFNLANVRIGGPYTITVTYVGYRTSSKDGIMLDLGQEYKADFGMEAESTQLSEVTVTSTGSQGKVFNSQSYGKPGNHYTRADRTTSNRKPEPAGLYATDAGSERTGIRRSE